MSVKILIASSLLMLALITMKCPAPNWNNPGVQSADELISGGKGVVIPDLTSQAQASRAAQMGESGKDILNQASGSALSSGASTPQEARSQDLSKTTATQSNTTDEVTPSQTMTSTQVFGGWSLELNDNEPHLANLTIFQDEDAVYGTGTIKLDAGNAVTATASGTVSGQDMSLDLVSVEKVSLYRISMTVSGDSAIGNYVVYSPGEASITGTAKGVRAAPSS